jgi:glycosyltransferase involved in cell wall biosynthesis
MVHAAPSGNRANRALDLLVSKTHQRNESMTKRRITFVLPAVGIAGGVKVVFQYANHLVDASHEVHIIYPGVLRPSGRAGWRGEAALRKLKYAVASAFGVSEAESWFPLRASIHHTPSLEARYIPHGDYLIATALETAEWVALAPANRGKKVYFIQDVESWSVGEEAALATWKLPFDARFVISSTLATVAARQQVPIDAILPDGVDVSQFHCEQKAFRTPRRVLMLSHTHARKGVDDGLAAVRIVRDHHPEVRLRMFGAIPPLPSMPAGTEYHQRPEPEELRQLYCSSDIYLACSRREGFGLPALEAMACGCALVATDTGAIPELTDQGQLGLVVEPGDIGGMADAILRLVSDHTLMERLGRAGQDRVHREFTLERAAQNFAAHLLAV